MGSRRCGNAKGMAAWRVKAAVLAASVLCACGTDTATQTDTAPTPAPAPAAAMQAAAAPEDNCPSMHPYMADEQSPFGWKLAPGDWSWDREDCWESKYMLCGGKARSPIDIDLRMDPFICPTAVHGADGVLAKGADYKAQSGVRASISKYMGSAMVSGDFGSITVSEGDVYKTYEATQVHIVSPSIHKINGSHFDAEMMIIHKPQGAPDALERSVIVSTMFSVSSAGVSQVFSGFGFTPEGSSLNEGLPGWDVPGSINIPSDIYSALQGPSYLYNGSVPAPPCTENVNWFVLGAVQPIGAKQVEKLQAMLQQVPGVQHRPIFPRQSSSLTCRRVEVNSAHIGGSHEGPTCQAALAAGKAHLSARCWESLGHCYSKTFSAADIDTSRAVQPADGEAMGISEFMHYKPVTNLQVKSGDYAVHATPVKETDLGHLMLKGHIYFAHNISVKPIASHTINGARHEAEITIEHVLFGDTYGHGLPGHQAEPMHIVNSVFLVKKGKHSEFLADLGLGDDVRDAAIRDGTHYDIEEEIDLGTLLKPALEGSWYWYSSNSTHKDCGYSTRWMVFETPLEASMEQLNSLSMKVSGPDSTQMPNTIPDGYVWKQHFPSFAVESNETDCGNLPQVEFVYGEEHPLWNYGNERCWNSLYPLCGSGTSQSPIDIPSTSPDVHVGTDSFLQRISWKPVSGLRVSNTGHNIQVTNGQMGYTKYVGDNGFQDYYSIAQFHIHMPSEHMINGKQYAAELHIVHKLQNAVNDLAGDDLLVMGIMFDFGDQASPLLNQLFMGNNSQISHDGQHATLKRPLDLARAVGPVLEGKYYRYAGGLTTPPCSEVVKWFVFEDALSMSQEQWLSFKALYPNPSNNRPIQPLNGRDVHQNSAAEGELLDFRYFLGRDSGRDRMEPEVLKILVPIFGTVILLTVVSCAMWVREESTRKQQSAGGFEPAASTYGKGYEQFDKPSKTN